MQKPNFRWRVIPAVAALAVTIGPSTAAYAWTEAVLHSFTGGSDGWYPLSNLIADQSGNLYGTTYFGGGACINKRGCGTVFKLAPDGTESVLYAFRKGKDGGGPMGGLVLDSQGNFYGTTFGGGKHNCGTVFEVTPQGVETVFYTFKCSTDGSNPAAGLTIDQAGNLYGTTTSGGITCSCGTVFEVTPAGVHMVLYSFQGTLNGGKDGADPQAPLIVDTAGNLYGTTVSGGSMRCGCGTVFKLALDSTETVLHVFRGGQDGEFPSGGLLIDGSGNLYGSTVDGGGTGCAGIGCGTVFEVTPDGTETILSRFNQSGGPANPDGGVIKDSSGNLFGTAGGGAAACGTVFRLAPGAKAKTIYSFTCGNDGAAPIAGVLQDHLGNLYGTTEGGGTAKDGTVFALEQ